MAGPSTCDADKAVKEMFYLCVEKCAGKELPVAEKSEAKSNAVNKLFKECFDGKVANTVDATLFCKYCDKKSKKLAVDAFAGSLLLDLAKTLAVEKKKTKTPNNDDPAVLEELNHIKKKIADKYHEWISAEKKNTNMAVVDRLTDVKHYTGSHKERFDAETGKGKGMEGTHDLADTSGYVGGYKGAGTYDKKHPQ